MKLALPVLLAFAVSLVLSTSAHADTRRLAIVVGNNEGSGSQPALRFAESDADKLARVLLELGDVRSGDLALLKGASADTVRAAVRAAHAKVEESHARGERSVLVFYFSGHSDGEALELGRARLSFSEIRSLLEATNADLRVAIVDTCKSGALLAIKGGTPSPAFQIRLSDELVSKGEALLTSSAASEVALESREIGGSFFTHHLVSGLRGAADRSADGRVTLAEAYDYAFARTVSATARTVVGPQHPAYEYRIEGEGELVLSRLEREGQVATLALPRDFERVVVLDAKSDRVLAEVSAGFSHQLSLPEGRLRVIAFRGGRVFEREVVLVKGQKAQLDATSFHAVGSAHIAGKGAGLERVDGDETAPFYRRVGVSLGGGVTQGVAARLSAVPSLRATLELGALSGLTMSMQAASGRDPSFRETTSTAALGGRYGRKLRRVSLFAGGEIGGGAVIQRANGQRFTSGVGYLAPTVAASFDIHQRVSLLGQLSYAAQLLRRDGALDARFVPAAWLGVRVSP